MNDLYWLVPLALFGFLAVLVDALTASQALRDRVEGRK